MKQLLLLLSTALLAALPFTTKADDSVLRGVGDTSGFDPDLASQFYETITSSTPMQANTLRTTATAAVSGNVFAEVSMDSGTNVSVMNKTTNNTAIQITPKFLPSGAYEVYVVTGDQTSHAVGSFVMPATVTTTTDGPNNTLIINNQIILQPVPVAPLPDNDFIKDSNSLGYTWMQSGIVRFATAGMPVLNFKTPKVGRTPSTLQEVPTGQFDDSINPFDINSIVIKNAYTGATVLTSPLKGSTSLDTTNTNLLSLVMPTSDESMAGGIANLKTGFSRTRTKLTKTGSLNFSATGLPAGKTYEIWTNGIDTTNTVVSNSLGSITITSSSLSRRKNSSGLTIIAGGGVDFFSLTSITLTDKDTGKAAMWVGF